MKRNIRLGAVALALAASASVAFAQQRIPVAVHDLGKDDATQHFTFLFKEAVRKSGLLTLVDDQDVGYQVRISALVGEEPVKGLVVYSGVLTFRYQNGKIVDDEYINNVFGYCGSEKTEYCANALYERIAINIDNNRKALEAAIEALPKNSGPIGGKSKAPE